MSQVVGALLVIAVATGITWLIMMGLLNLLVWFGFLVL